MCYLFHLLLSQCFLLSTNHYFGVVVQIWRQICDCQYWMMTQLLFFIYLKWANVNLKKKQLFIKFLSFLMKEHIVNLHALLLWPGVMTSLSSGEKSVIIIILIIYFNCPTMPYIPKESVYLATTVSVFQRFYRAVHHFTVFNYVSEVLNSTFWVNPLAAMGNVSLLYYKHNYT